MSKKKTSRYVVGANVIGAVVQMRTAPLLRMTTPIARPTPSLSNASFKSGVLIPTLSNTILKPSVLTPALSNTILKTTGTAASFTPVLHVPTTHTSDDPTTTPPVKTYTPITITPVLMTSIITAAQALTTFLVPYAATKIIPSDLWTAFSSAHPTASFPAGYTLGPPSTTTTTVTAPTGAYQWPTAGLAATAPNPNNPSLLMNGQPNPDPPNPSNPLYLTDGTPNPYAPNPANPSMTMSGQMNPNPPNPNMPGYLMSGAIDPYYQQEMAAGGIQQTVSPYGGAAAYGGMSGGGGGFGGGDSGGGDGTDPGDPGDVDWGDGSDGSSGQGDGSSDGGGGDDDSGDALVADANAEFADSGDGSDDDSNIDWGDGSDSSSDGVSGYANENPYLTGMRVLGSSGAKSMFAIGTDTIPAAVSYTDHDTVLAVQTALKTKGYNPGTLDGIFGPNTSKAIKAMQKDAGIGTTGIVDYGVLMALGVQAPSYTPTITYAGSSGSAAAQAVANLAVGLADNATTPADVQAASQQVTAANAVALPPPPPEVQAKVAKASAAAKAAKSPAEIKDAAAQVKDAAAAVVSATSFWGKPMWSGAPIKRWQGVVGLGGGIAVAAGFVILARRR